MLRINTGSPSTDCDRIGRRDFLMAGSLALGSLSLPQLLAARAAGGAKGSGVDINRDCSVVLLYLSGGASQIETFDPKDSARGGVRSVTGSVASKISGVRFGATFPGLASRADRLAVVRSFQHRVGSHVQAHVHMLTGGTDSKGDGSSGFSMGSMVSRIRGSNHFDSGLPTFSLLTANEVDRQYRSELGRVRLGSKPGELGEAYAPFEPGGKGAALENMTLNLPAERFGERKQLLRTLDRIKRRHLPQINAQAPAKTGAAGNRFYQQAVDLLLKGATSAFDLSTVDPRLLEKYDTSQIQIGFREFRPSTLGRQMLMARRLCEAGCGFVTVHSAGWDMHADSNNPNMVVGMEMLGRSLDKAVSAFLDDVRQRGLEKKILLVITGDFGRTPKVNKRGGRDHWPRLCPLMFAGGRVRGGQVIGQSTRDAGEPASTPYSTQHLMGSVMDSLFDVGQLRLESGIPQKILRQIEQATPIKELF